MQSNGIFTEDIIFIMSKDTVFSKESSIGNEKAIEKSATNMSDFCSGVLVYEDNKAVLKLLPSTPQNILKKIKSGKLYIR